MSTSSAVLQIHQRDAFERNVTRALVAGAGAGALAFVTHRFGLPVPLTFLAIAGTALAAVRGDKMDRIMLAAAAVVLPAAPWLFGLSQAWTVAAAGAAAGAVMVRSRLCDRGGEQAVATKRPGLMHYLVGGGATAALALGGMEVAKVLAARMADLQTPALLATVVSGMVVALFAGIGGIFAHLALKADPVEARCEELIPQLSGEFQELSRRALELYRHAGESLASLPRDPAREELARTLQRLTKDAVELAAEWAGVEVQLQDETAKELNKEVAELHRNAAEAKDPVARRQLELAAASLREEVDRLADLRLKRERILAKLKSQVALLERARVSLIGLRSGHAQIKAAEMTALARKFSALAATTADEARLAHEVATGAELASQDAELAHAVKVAESVALAPVPSPSAPAPVSAPVREELAPASAPSDSIKN